MEGKQQQISSHGMLCSIKLCCILLCFTNAFATVDIRSFSQLDVQMLSTLAQQRQEYKQQFFKRHPVIVALFTVDGGQFILYQPGKRPQIANIDKAFNYRMAGIVEHTVMITYELSRAYINTSNDANKQFQLKHVQQLNTDKH